MPDIIWADIYHAASFFDVVVSVCLIGLAFAVGYLLAEVRRLGKIIDDK